MKNLIYRIFQNSGLVIISLGLLFGGVAILNTQIPFWSLVYGIPAVFLGIVISIITFNELAKSHWTAAAEYHQIPCRICHKMTLVPMLVESTVCSDCQYKMAMKLQIGFLIFLALIALPVTFHLSQQEQDLRQNAKTPKSSPICEAGQWSPASCSCGVWLPETTCAEGEFARSCGTKIYCCTPDLQNWNCRPK